MERLRPLWESLYTEGQSTIFQSFEWNLLAARTFSSREEPFVISVEASYGAAIIPAVIRRSDQTVRLMGEELFDYRGFLHDGEDEVLRAGLATLAQVEHPLEVVAMRECDRLAAFEDLQLVPFAAAPSVNCAEITAEKFSAEHNRLGRNLRRFERMGFEIRSYNGENSELLRSIYQRKAAQEPSSLFHDRCRMDFIVDAARRLPASCEIFTLECESKMTAALITFRDDTYRRFYTCWFDAEFSKLSPSMVLIHEITRRSLLESIHCDYMTGEQGYKLRLATSSMPLYRLQATPEQLAALSEAVQPALPLAG